VLNKFENIKQRVLLHENLEENVEETKVLLAKRMSPENVVVEQKGVIV